MAYDITTKILFDKLLMLIIATVLVCVILVLRLPRIIFNYAIIKPLMFSEFKIITFLTDKY